MNPLQASCIGIKAWEDSANKPRGFIHSSFERAVNMSIGGDLYSVATAGVPRTPFTVTVDGLETITSLGEGQDVQLKADGLYVKHRLVVDTASAPIWRPRSTEGAAEPRLAADRLTESLHVHGRGGGLKPLLDMFGVQGDEDTPYSSRARAIVQGLLGDGLGEDSLMHAAKLIGLGPGLTPSGDDLLSGLMSTLHLSRLPGGLLKAKTRLTQRVLSEAGSKTNAISGFMLKHYSEGLIDENTDDLITALSQGSPTRLDEAVERLSRTGHSSGTDLAVGVLVALRLMEKSKW